MKLALTAADSGADSQLSCFALGLLITWFYSFSSD